MRMNGIALYAERLYQKFVACQVVTLSYANKYNNIVPLILVFMAGY